MSVNLFVSFVVVLCAVLNGGKQLSYVPATQRSDDNSPSFLLPHTSDSDYLDKRCFSTSSASVTYFYKADLIEFASFDGLLNGADFFDNKSITIYAEAPVNLGFEWINVDVYDRETNLFSETIYAYHTMGENGGIDIRLDFHTGCRLASEMLCERETDMDDMPTPLIELSLPIRVQIPIASISLQLANYNDAFLLIDPLITIPVLTLENPLAYLFYLAKIEVIKHNFATNTVGQNGYLYRYIDNQNTDNVRDWIFGFGCDINQNGCGIVAVHNALKDCGVDENFAALISLFELAGADLVFGHLGVNPIPQETVLSLLTAFVSVYESLLKPFLNLALTIIEPLLCALCGITPADLIVPGISSIIVLSAIGSLRTIVNVAADACERFLIWYCSFLHSEYDVMKLVFGSNKISSYGSLSNYKTALRSCRQGIVCFWNEPGDNPWGISIQSGAHFVYIYGYSFDLIRGTCLSYKGRNTLNPTFDEETTFSTSQLELLFGSESQYLWGYTIHD